MLCPKEPAPWKWLAIESLISHCVSEKSDVWSFGSYLIWNLFIQFQLVHTRNCKPCKFYEIIYKMVHNLTMHRDAIFKYLLTIK